MGEGRADGIEGDVSDGWGFLRSHRLTIASRLSERENHRGPSMRGQIIDSGDKHSRADLRVDEILFEVERHALGIQEFEEHQRAGSVSEDRKSTRLNSSHVA